MTMMRPGIYLDAAASTPLDPGVVERMLAVLRGEPGNPSSAHWAGENARRRVDEAREQVGVLTSLSPARVVFTSGATEANNLALFGLVEGAGAGRSVVVTTTTEHAAVGAPLAALAATGVKVIRVGVTSTGQVDLAALARVVDERTLLVSVMAANNETGVLAPLSRIVELARKVGALVHTDASQLLAWGPLPFEHGLDLVTISGHKMHGPQGVGALALSRAAYGRLRARQYGGGQERGLRSGTLNVAGIVGLGVAAELAVTAGPSTSGPVTARRDALFAALTAELPRVLLNGHPTARLPGLLSVALGDTGYEIDATAVLARMPEVAAATGSACSSGAIGPSPVLTAMGLSTARARSTLRLSLSRMSTDSDVDRVVPRIVAAVRDVEALTGAGRYEVSA